MFRGPEEAIPRATLVSVKTLLSAIFCSFLFLGNLLGGVGKGPGCTKGGRNGTQSLYKKDVACATAAIIGDTVAAFGGAG